MDITPFIEYLRTELRYSSHTLLSYQKDLEEFLLFLKETEAIESAKEIEAIHIRNFIMHLSEKQRKPSTINRKIAALKRYFRYLVKREIISKSPAQAIKNLKKPKEVHLPYSQKEMADKPDLEETSEMTLSAFQNALIVELLYQTGMRRAELIELKEVDFSEDQRTMKVLGKRNKERMIPISKELAEALNSFMERKIKEERLSPYLFCLENGKKLYPKFVYKVVNLYLSTLTTKDKKSPHMLRHTFATHLLNNGAEINSVKEILGHSSLASTQVYTHQDIEVLKKVLQDNHPREINS